MIKPEYLYLYLAIIFMAGGIACVLILRKQKQDREQKAATADKTQEARTVSAPSRQSEPAAPSADMIDLHTVLDKEELRLLSTDLSCTADKLQAQGFGTEEVNVVRVLCELVSKSGVIPKQALNLCIVASQDMVDSVASTFGLSMGGHNALLEKLKKLQEGSD